VARSILNPDSARAEMLPSKFVRTLRRNDVFRAELPGSGGYGDPFAREPEAVRRDVAQGKVTAEHAKSAYGVAVDADGRQVDAEATARLRAAHGARQSDP
jgi:N-methylhydantoinase B